MESRTSASFPQFQTLIVAISEDYIGLVSPKVGNVLSKIYGLSTGNKVMAQPTAQKLETTNSRKIDDGNPNNSANRDIYAYSETTFGGPTIGCVMTENWLYGCCCF